MSALTPETLAELRRLLDEATPDEWVHDGEGEVWDASLSDFICHPVGIADAALIAAAVNALPALLDAAEKRDRLAAAVERVRALATEWAEQPTDYDEDTEQQIEDGSAILRALDATQTGGES